MKNKYANCRYSYTDFLMEYDKKDHHSNLIRWIVDLTNCQNYLEIGVESGDCIRNIRDVVKKCVAVDVADMMVDKDKIEFHHMTSDDFFKNNKEMFDIIFIDGDHNFEQARLDFENSLIFLNKHGIILLHDTDPMLFGLTHVKYCSDTHRIVDYILDYHPDLNIITLPINEMGLSVVMRKQDRRRDKNWPAHWSKTGETPT